MINPDDIPGMVSRMWLMHTKELARFDIIDDYVQGKLGRPDLPESADREVRGIWKICVHNILDVVVDTFAQNLSVVGYRNQDAKQNAAGWDDWQRNKMDARQAEIYLSALKYGVGYVTVTPSLDGPVFRPRSPRQLLALYEDPQVDDWPQYALETWVDETDGKPRRKGNFFDDTYVWPVDLGEAVTPPRDEDGKIQRAIITITQNGIEKPVPHNAGVCPVVRYINRRDSEHLVGGEVERLIVDQLEINEVNFDRLIVARFGAFPQKVIAGWSGTKSEVLEASARRVWAFDDETVKAWTLAPASVEPYNSLLDEMKQHVALRAKLSPASVTGKMVNLSAEALAAAEADQQRKLGTMRESHGEAHEQLLGLSAKLKGDKNTAGDQAAEVMWRDTEARSFGVMADGILKIAQAIAAGMPIGPLLPLVPGLTQQMIAALEKEMQKASVTNLVSSITAAAQQASQNGQVAALSGQKTEAPSAPTAS
jgi:hypothetical protein